MTEQEFFGHLEMRVSRELAGMRQKALQTLWCDGFIPEEFSVVGQRCRISGRAWLAFGQETQECWRFILHLGAASPRETIDWKLMLPAEDCMGWLALDFETKFMKVGPQSAYADGKPADGQLR